MEQITPYPVLPQNEGGNIHFLPLQRIIWKIMGEKQGGWDPFIKRQWGARDPGARRSLVEKQVGVRSL